MITKIEEVNSFGKKINTMDTDFKYFYMIQYLNQMIDLSSIFKYNDYNNLNMLQIYLWMEMLR